MAKKSYLFVNTLVFVIEAEIRASLLAGVEHSHHLVLIKGKVAGIFLVFLVPIPIQTVLAATLG